jgi:chromosome segregation ATPase
MSYDIQQWILEIKSLQQQLADMQRDRDAALDSAANWRQLYNTEAQQRRDEAVRSQQTIESLKAEIQQLHEEVAGVESLSDPGAISASVEQIQNVAELQAKLVEVLIERDRLAQALKDEHLAHNQTREKLTTALGDAVDVLTSVQRRSHAQIEEESIEENPPASTGLPGASQPVPGLANTPKPVADLPAFVKTPSLKLPPTRPAPPRF